MLPHLFILEILVPLVVHLARNPSFLGSYPCQDHKVAVLLHKTPAAGSSFSGFFLVLSKVTFVATRWQHSSTSMLLPTEYQFWQCVLPKASRLFHFALVLNAKCHVSCPWEIAKKGTFIHFKLHGDSCAPDIRSPPHPPASSQATPEDPVWGWRGAGSAGRSTLASQQRVGPEGFRGNFECGIEGCRRQLSSGLGAVCQGGAGGLA